MGATGNHEMFHDCASWRNLLSLFLCSLWWVQIVWYVLAWRSYSFICILHHLIIIIVQTYLKTLNLWNACQIYFVVCVSGTRHILSVIHYTIRGAVCFQFTHFPCDHFENIYTLSYYHDHQIGSMKYYPLFRVRSWNNGVRCMSFCILLKSYTVQNLTCTKINIAVAIIRGVFVSWRPFRLGLNVFWREYNRDMDKYWH